MSGTGPLDRAAERPQQNPRPRPRPVSAPDARSRSRWLATRWWVRPLRRWQRWTVGVGSVLLVLVAIAAAVVVIQHVDGGGTQLTATRATAAELTDAQRAQGFIAGATSDIAAVSSYDYRTLDDALAAGSAVSTGGFRQSFRAALQGSLGAAAKQQRIVQTFDLVRAGIGSVSKDSATAKVLVFGVRTVTNDRPNGATRTSALTLTATMQRRGDRYLISDLESGTNPGLPPGTGQLVVAAEAGREQVVDLLSYRRDHFAADNERALNNAVEPLRSQLMRSAADTRGALQAGKYDLSGAVTALAVEQASGDTVQLLVAATGTKIAANGARSDLTDGRYEVTVVLAGGYWRVSAVQSVLAG
ncbi:MAG: hypothetical protein ACR2LX_16255 [Jatrophihabitans sp.]